MIRTTWGLPRLSRIHPVLDAAFDDAVQMGTPNFRRRERNPRAWELVVSVAAAESSEFEPTRNRTFLQRFPDFLTGSNANSRTLTLFCLISEQR